MAYSSTLYRSSYEPAGYSTGYSTPTKSSYTSPYAQGVTGSGGSRYYDHGHSTETPTPLSSRGTRYSAEGYHGLTPTPGQRPLTSASTTQRRAYTPTTGGSARNWDVTPNTSNHGAGGYYGGGGSVRKNLNPELSLAQDKYSARNNLASLHPNATANSAGNRQNPTGYFSHRELADSNFSGGGSPQQESRSTSWQSPYGQQQQQPVKTITHSPGRQRTRRPSMVKNGHYFIPPQDGADRGKPLVVLDLDETLVYARQGPVNVRPGVRELLSTLDGRAEVAVWTAGERDYAQGVIERIDPNRTIQHCVYRHPKWWTGQPGYSKDLNNLGRSLDRVILIDNTPDCLKDQPWNSLLVEDYTGRADRELAGVTKTLEFILDSDPSEKIPDILSQCPHVCRRRIPLDGYGQSDLWTLSDSTGDYSPGRGSRVNRDLPVQRASSSSRAGSMGSTMPYWKRSY